MFKKSNYKHIAKLAAAAFLLQACTPTTPKANVPDASISEVKLMADSVTTGKIKDQNVTTAKIADGAITAAKLASSIAIAAGSITVAGASVLTGAVTMSSTASVADTLTLTKTSVDVAAGDVYGFNQTLTLSPAAATATTFFGSRTYVPLTTLQNATGTIVAGTNHFNNTAAGTVTLVYGSQALAQNSAGGTITTGIGIMGRSYNSNTGTFVTANGVYGDIFNSSTGIVTTGVGVAGAVVNTSTGTITTGYALAASRTNSGGGAITTYHGVHLTDPGTGYAANQYNIFSDGLVYNHIAGRLGIGMLNPSVELDVTGDIEYTGSIADVSDARMKENVSPIENALEVLRQMRLYSYTMKNDPKKRTEFGLMAQELQPLLPPLVKTVDPVNQTYGVNYIGLIPWALKAIQESDREVASVKAENSELRARLDKIEEQNKLLAKQMQQLLGARKK